MEYTIDVASVKDEVLESLAIEADLFIMVSEIQIKKIVFCNELLLWSDKPEDLASVEVLEGFKKAVESKTVELTCVLSEKQTRVSDETFQNHRAIQLQTLIPRWETKHFQNSVKLQFLADNDKRLLLEVENIELEGAILAGRDFLASFTKSV